MKLQLTLASSVAAVLLHASVASAGTLPVGPGKTYAAPCAAIAAAGAGDTIEIDAAGSYVGDVCSWKTESLTIRGVGGRPKIDAGGKNAGGKGTWVIYAQVATIENVEMFGAAVPDNNGAAIRQQGKDLTVRHCYFHDNQDGILTGPLDASGATALGTGTIRIEYSEFAHNGAGDGLSHNMYIGASAQFWLVGSYSHDTVEGHLVKTRAYENHILYNRIVDGTAGSPSYELDVPQGGLTFIIGNVIVQNDTTHNPTIVNFAEEIDKPLNPGSALYFVNNTLVNDRGAGGTFINVDPRVTFASIVRNDIIVGKGAVCTQASAVLDHDYSGADPKFLNAAIGDYHLADSSPCIDKGVDPGSAGTVSLAPTEQYLDPAGVEGRSVVGGVIDIGAFEKGGGVPLTDAGGTDSGGTADASSGDSGSGSDASASDASGSSDATGTGASDASSDGGGATNSGGGCGCRHERSALGVSPVVSLVVIAGLFARRKRSRDVV